MGARNWIRRPHLPLAGKQLSTLSSEFIAHICCSEFRVHRAYAVPEDLFPRMSDTICICSALLYSFVLHLSLVNHTMIFQVAGTSTLNQSRQLHHGRHPYQSIMAHLLELLLPLLFYLFCFAAASAALLCSSLPPASFTLLLCFALGRPPSYCSAPPTSSSMPARLQRHACSLQAAPHRPPPDWRATRTSAARPDLWWGSRLALAVGADCAFLLCRARFVHPVEIIYSFCIVQQLWDDSSLCPFVLYQLFLHDLFTLSWICAWSMTARPWQVKIPQLKLN
jgi:hypothetical protein